MMYGVREVNQLCTFGGSPRSTDRPVVLRQSAVYRLDCQATLDELSTHLAQFARLWQWRMLHGTSYVEQYCTATNFRDFTEIKRSNTDQSPVMCPHGFAPVDSSRTTHPSDHMSHDPSRPPLSLFTTSGDMYCGVPLKLCCFSRGSRPAMILAVPKSANFATPLKSSKTSKQD